MFMDVPAEQSMQAVLMTRIAVLAERCVHRLVSKNHPQLQNVATLQRIVHTSQSLSAPGILGMVHVHLVEHSTVDVTAHADIKVLVPS